MTSLLWASNTVRQAPQRTWPFAACSWAGDARKDTEQLGHRVMMSVIAVVLPHPGQLLQVLFLGSVYFTLNYAIKQIIRLVQRPYRMH